MKRIYLLIVCTAVIFWVMWATLGLISMRSQYLFLKAEIEDMQVMMTEGDRYD